eukprot:5629669-Prymnesium_polylepis.1
MSREYTVGSSACGAACALCTLRPGRLASARTGRLVLGVPVRERGATQWWRALLVHTWFA